MKTMIYIGFAVLVYLLIGSATSYAIPNENIRIRVIANSDDTYDQTVKGKVKEQLQDNLYNLLKDTTDISKARQIINSNIDKIDTNVDEVLKANNYPLTYRVNYGLNYFPSKEYKGVTYNEGYYESLVVTLGKGEGSNWWCVLFPPLCLLEAEESDDVEYTSYVKELFNKYL